MAAQIAADMPTPAVVRTLPHPSSLEVAWVETYAELDALADDWNRLADGNPFMCYEWLSTWWSYYSQRRWRLMVLVVRDYHGHVVGIAPWYLRRSALLGRTIALLGSGEVCSEYSRILADADRGEDVAQAIASFLTSRHAPTWDRIEWLNVESGPAVHNRVAQLLTMRGCEPHVTPGLSCWRMRVSNDWERYVTHLSRKKREIVRQVHRKTFDSGRLTIHNVTSPEQLPKAMDILIDLHQRRRNLIGELGCFSSPQFLAYHHAVAAKMLERGELFLCWIELDGQPAVVWYGLRSDTTLYLYQTGFNPDLSKASPGSIGVMAAIKLAMQWRLHEIDFLRGDEPYKATWGAEPQATLNLRIAANRGTSHIRHSIWKNGRRAKRMVKQCLSWMGLLSYIPESTH